MTTRVKQFATFTQQNVIAFGLFCFVINIAIRLLVPLNTVDASGFVDSIRDWDGDWYIKLAHYGYPDKAFFDVHGFTFQSTAGFFPMFPLLIRAVHEITPFNYTVSAAIVGFTFSICAFITLGLLLRNLLDISLANKTVFLTAIAPGAFVFTMAYSEGLFLTMTALFILFLVQKRFGWAALVGAVAALTRANAIILIAIAAASVYKNRKNLTTKQFLPIIAPALALGAFFAYDAIHIGDPFAYFHNQSYGWGMRFDFGLTLLRHFPSLLVDPAHSQGRDLTARFAIIMVVLSVLVIRDKMPWQLKWYGIGTVILALGSTSLWSYPRFAMTAFPLMIPIARNFRGRMFAVAAVCIFFVALVSWRMVALHTVVP